MEPKLFTPNTERGGVLRYRLYRRGTNLFSITPESKPFRASEERDACGLGCFCGAFITPQGKRGIAELAKAIQIGSNLEPV